MSSIIKQAITHKCMLKLYDAEGCRIVEPYAFGLDIKGRSLLLCFQPGRDENAPNLNIWCVVHLDELKSIDLLNESFSRIQSGYIRNHPAFHTVLLQV